MKLRIVLTILVCTIAGLIATSCGDDDPVAPPPLKDDDFKDLTQKDDVLFNLEWLFNEFNQSQYDKLLDDDFVFFFSDADFSSGRTPKQWTREYEIMAYKGFYDPNRAEKRVIDRSLVLTYADDAWTEIAPYDPVKYAGESWYLTTVEYDMAIMIDVSPEVTYVASNIQMEVTIRWDTDKGHYRMIGWKDGVGGLGSSVSGVDASVQKTTWGAVKVLCGN